MSIKKILISQPKPETGKSPYYDVAARYDAEVTFRSFISVEQLSQREFRDQRINILDYTAVIFTTRKAMEHYFGLAQEMRITIPEDMKYFCLNEQIANYLQKFTVYRKRKVFFPTVGNNQEALVALIYKHSKEKYLIPAPEEHKRDLQTMLEAKKIQHTTAIMFRTVSAVLTPEELAEKFDMYIFFTPIGVKALRSNYPDFEQGDIRIGAFGAGTAKTVEDLGLRLDLSAPTAQFTSMALALEDYLEKNR
ncbi:MAG: uroporphyrinogen-III synthase [Porphyromonas sp.]|nr:uroporphyrinogen-III synthase [Porphyromonas sp.]